MTGGMSAGKSEAQLRRAVLDRDRTMPGRGAYLCSAGTRDRPCAECFSQASRRGALSRALRCTVKIDSELLESISQ